MMKMRFESTSKIDIDSVIVLKKILDAGEGGCTFSKLGTNVFRELKMLNAQKARPIGRSRLYDIIDFWADKGVILKIGRPLVIEISEKQKKRSASIVQGFMDMIDEYDGAKLNAF